MHGPWEMQKTLLAQTMQCIRKHPVSEVPSILVCLEPLRSHYEKARQQHSTQGMARTLTAQPFITQDLKEVFVGPFIAKHAANLLDNPAQRQQLDEILAQNKLPQAAAFLQNMLSWQEHVAQDKPL